MNAIALQDAMRQAKVEAKVQSAIRIDQIVEPYMRQKAMKYLNEKKVVIFAAGTGNPFFTTDTAAALRGAEIGAELLSRLQELMVFMNLIRKKIQTLKCMIQFLLTR